MHSQPDSERPILHRPIFALHGNTSFSVEIKFIRDNRASAVYNRLYKVTTASPPWRDALQSFNKY